MTEFILRPARTTDAGRGGAILSEFIDTTPWMPRIHTRAQDIGFVGQMIDRGWVSVAETAQGVAGFLSRDQGEVHALYVAANSRNLGIGGALLKEAQRQSPALTLYTFQANAGAQRFYLRHGFEEAARSDGQDNDEKLPDIRYQWERQMS